MNIREKLHLSHEDIVSIALDTVSFAATVIALNINESRTFSTRFMSAVEILLIEKVIAVAFHYLEKEVQHHPEIFKHFWKLRDIFWTVEAKICKLILIKSQTEVNETGYLVGGWKKRVIQLWANKDLATVNAYPHVYAVTKLKKIELIKSIIFSSITSLTIAHVFYLINHSITHGTSLPGLSWRKSMLFAVSNVSLSIITPHIIFYINTR